MKLLQKNHALHHMCSNKNTHPPNKVRAEGGGGRERERERNFLSAAGQFGCFCSGVLTSCAPTRAEGKDGREGKPVLLLLLAVATFCFPYFVAKGRHFLFFFF